MKIVFDLEEPIENESVCIFELQELADKRYFVGTSQKNISKKRIFNRKIDNEILR